VSTHPSGPAAQAPYLRIENVTKRFGDFVAVNDVSLDVQRGEIFCLLGGSGSGKTTLLRMLAGFEIPTSGKIYIDGQDMCDIPPYDRPVNMMFQSYALFPHMTVEKNVAFGLEQERLGRQEIRRRVGEILEIVKMSSFLARKPHQLSGGQRQRVALARALVKRPKLLLLDEPLAALDRKLREHTQFELINIQEQLGVTFMVVTHDQEEAMTLSSRMGVMNHGQIAQVGTPTDIYEFPATRFVADFIGSVNMFEGKLIEDEPDFVRIRCEDLGGVVYVNHGISSAPDATVWVAVRPEKINISRQPPGPADGVHQPGTVAGENMVRGTVKEIAYMGDMSIYLVQAESGKTIRVTIPNVARHTEDRITWDETVYVSWHAESPVVLTR
jgi:putrescine transport system ATP-binding protein